jgi:hypothetical protein
MHYYNYQPYGRSDMTFKSQRPPSNLGFNYDNEYKDVRIDKINPQLLNNIVEYNKNLLPDQVDQSNFANILKYDNLMTLSEFDKMMIAKQYQKLYGKTEEANEEILDNYEDSKFYNKSLSELVYNFTGVMMELIHEIPKAYEDNELNYKILTKNDRSIYVGMFFVLLSIFLYFINLTK